VWLSPFVLLFFLVFQKSVTGQCRCFCAAKILSAAGKMQAAYFSIGILREINPRRTKRQVLTTPLFPTEKFANQFPSL
jgi:hypothetical protein